MSVCDIPAAKIGKSAFYTYEVNAKGGRGKSETSRSPEDKIRRYYNFRPNYSGIWNFSIPIKFNGVYEVNAEQKGAGGRQAVVEIAIIDTITNRGESRKGYRKRIFKQKVTKGNSSGPFNHTHIYSRDVDTWVGTKPEQTIKSGVTISIRAELYAFAKWHKSRALLNFRKPGSIEIGPATVTLKLAKPRKGEQAPPKK
jgi:hypothetical protein